MDDYLLEMSVIFSGDLRNGKVVIRIKSLKVKLLSNIYIFAG